MLEAISLAATLPQLPLPTTVTLEMCEAAEATLVNAFLGAASGASMAAGGAMRKEEEERKGERREREMEKKDGEEEE